MNFPGSVVTSHRHPRGTMEALSHKTDLGMGPRAGIVGWSFYDARELMESFPEEKKKSTKCCKLHSFRRNLVEVGG